MINKKQSEHDKKFPCRKIERKFILSWNGPAFDTIWRSDETYSGQILNIGWKHFSAVRFYYFEQAINSISFQNCKNGVSFAFLEISKKFKKQFGSKNGVAQNWTHCLENTCWQHAPQGYFLGWGPQPIHTFSAFMRCYIELMYQKKSGKIVMKEYIKQS